MKTFEFSETIDKPLEQVFAYATDLEKTKEWLNGVEKIEILDPGPLKAGTRFKETRQANGRRMENVMRVLAHEAPRAHAVGATIMGVEFGVHFGFESAGDARTKVTARYEARAANLFGKLFEGMMIRSVRKNDATMLANLKERLEKA